MNLTTASLMAFGSAVLLSLSVCRSAEPVEVSTTEGLKRAMGRARPGARIVLAGGVYRGGLWVGRARGRAGQPIVIAAKDPANPPVFRGGKMGFELESCSYVTLDGLVLEQAELNNLQMWRCDHVVMKNIVSRNIKGTSNCDGIKLTGVADFLIHNCRVSRWGAEGSAIDMVACARGLIANSHFTYPKVKGQTANTVQPKCGSFDIGVYRCRFDDSSFRAVQFGGGIGPGRINRYDRFGKLKQTGLSGVDMAAMGNVIVSGEAAVAYASCARCTFEYNTIVNPTKHVLRVLFEGGAEPTAANTFAHNLIVYGGLAEIVNVGPKTRPETFRFARNYWYNRLAPGKSTPKLPAREQSPAGGADPRLDAQHRPAKDSPARTYGAHAKAMEKAWAGHTRKFEWAWRQVRRPDRQSRTK